MKANQKFANADEAVSPVIGVILMVAITVVLAAVVFVLVSDLGETKDAAPNISFQKDATNDRLKIVSADEDADWDDIAITYTTGGACGTVSISYDGTSATVASGAAGPASSVDAGDYISFASGSGSCEVTLTHTPTNSLYDTWTFTL